MENKNPKDHSGKIFILCEASCFIVLKLFGAIDWSWWWVVSPLWIPLVAAFALLWIGGLISIIKELKK